MTIRARLILTQGIIGAVVVALCVLAIDLARMASEFARMPSLHMSSLDHIRDLLDATGQAVKDIDDIAKGEEDAEELASQMGRARTALDEIRRDARDGETFALVHQLDATFAAIERGKDQ